MRARLRWLLRGTTHHKAHQNPYVQKHRASLEARGFQVMPEAKKSRQHQHPKQHKARQHHRTKGW